ncbi:energy-coupled thiamine transporter ThiT [Spiroplasma alleghenense]|uniref:Thiamine transporter n=1 Tax=Spiroplasma alleghenense TaxID=216931 RepID=A0A345Z4C5_9MOLU|nr:energy-coupled thiamine transporter ThiT [Spiroplasma alleghenense]AXK51454.1 hypothetical protein SALLE_v1c07840 [Spiroplasma alleghenense]
MNSKIFKKEYQSNFDDFYKFSYFSIFDRIWAVIFSLTGLAVAIYLSTILLLKIQNSLYQSEDGESVVGRMALVIIAAVIINLLFLNSQIFKIILLTRYQHSYKGQLIFFTVFTLDIYLLVRVFLKDKKNFKYFSFMPKKWIIFDYVFLGISFALYFALGFISSLVPQLPFFITITIKFIPLYFLAFICDWTKVLVCSIICGGFEWFFPGTFIVNVPQFMFDYWIPPIGITLAAIFKPIATQKEKFKKLDFIVFVSIPIIWIYFSRVIAGVMFWSTFPWPGFNAWTYSLVFNSINTIVDYAVFIVAVPLICSNLSVFKDKYQAISSN